MDSLGRYRFTEITPERILSGIHARILEIPHSFAWNNSPSSKENKSNLIDLKNTCIGKRCFIVANGPSLQKMDLSKLKNEICFGLNRIYLNFPSSPFRPDYLVVINELILDQCASEIDALKIPKFINWNRRDYFHSESDQIFYVKSKMVIKDYFEKDITKPMVFGATVTFATLQIAFYMGFKQVILIGLDHNYKEKGIPSKVEIRSNEVDESHFDSRYFPKGFKWQLPDLFRSEIEYSIARDTYESEGREILDATIGGKCTIFKKIDYESLF